MKPLHPVLRLFFEHPQLAAEHAAAYAALFAEDGAVAAARLQRSLVLKLAACACAAIAATLAGVGAMLWAALPAASMTYAWVLAAVPVLPALAAACAWMAAPSDAVAAPFAALRRQVLTDIAWVRDARATAEAS